MGERTPANAATASLLDFILRHGQLRTNVCSRQHWDNGYTLPPRTISDYNFIYVTRGKVIWKIGDRPYELSPGQLAFVPPDKPHLGYSLTPGMTLVSVHVEMTLPGGQDAIALLAPPEFLQVPQDSALDRYLRGAMDEFQRPERSRTLEMLPGWAHLITIEFLRYCQKQGLLVAQTLTPVVADVLRHLHEHFAEEISLDELASYAGYSPQHLNRLFQRELGTTPLKHLMAMRLDRATRLLDKGVLTIAAVARQCGFTAPAYFSRVFRKRYGMGPATYQKMRGSENPSAGS